MNAEDFRYAADLAERIASALEHIAKVLERIEPYEGEENCTGLLNSIKTIGSELERGHDMIVERLDDIDCTLTAKMGDK